MQVFFKLKEEFKLYIELGKNYKFPSPEIVNCHKCNKLVQFKKHGFYNRYLVTFDYSGLIVIRRYICPLCGCTISYIPDVSMTRFVLSTELIFQSLYAYFKLVVLEIKQISRQLKRYYIKKFMSKITAIQTVLREILPNARLPDQSLSNIDKTRMVLQLIRSSKININDIAHRFYDLSGKSILQ